MADVETVVVGAGVVGLAIARALALRGHEVMVLERNERAGMETSSRSSEVIHAGIYYPTGSARARLCIRGKALLYDFCAETGVAHKRCGKLLVATDESELPALDAVAATAARNGVEDLHRMTVTDVRSLEPEIACIGAYLSPSTGIVDSHALLQALEGQIQSLGSEVVLNTTVETLEAAGSDFIVGIVNGEERSRLTARNLVLAAGLGATAVGSFLHYPADYAVPQTCPARGHYYALAGKAPFRHLVYPIPSGAWLGVHLTLDVGGRARFGPDIEWCDEISYAFDEDGGMRLARFERAIRRYWPGLPSAALQPDSVGIRPKIYREGEPVADFAIHGPRKHGIERLIALYGMESPGLTSSLAIGDYVAEMLASGQSTL